MSLYCDETKKDIDFDTPLMAGTRADVDLFSALSHETIGRIPMSERSGVPSKMCWGGGVDFHWAKSTRNPNGAYTVTGFRLGDFVFSISQEAAEKYLPEHIKRYPKVRVRKPRQKKLKAV